MLIEQIYSTDEDLRCERCNTSHGTFVSLSCDHKFCVLCLSFMYVKHRKLDPNQGTVKCSICQIITTLHPSHLQIVTKTLKQQFIPIIEGQNNLSKPKPFNKQIGNRKIKSQEQSFQQNNTPSAAKYFYSKCESPCSLKRESNLKFFCANHKNQIITHICFDCDMMPLCIKCTSSSKKHANHHVKDLEKGITIITEQASYTFMQITENIQRLQLYQKRYEDRKNIIKMRTEQILKHIRNSFENMYIKIKQKQEEIVEKCESNLDDFLHKNENQIQLLNQTLGVFTTFRERIIEIQKDRENLDFVYKWIDLKKKYATNQPITNIEFQLQQKIRFPSNSIIRQIDTFNQSISQINAHFKFTNVSRVGTIELENCKSQSKLKKQHNKRLKTNFVSLNSSREKKTKKTTKTQEDQRRLRTQKFNIDKQKRNSKMPAYITDYINKKTHKFGSDGNSIAVLQMTTPNIQNSKLTNKLSKTISPQQINYKKKDNMALIKQRIQRKTTQPTSKLKTESGKKKKAH